jgi:hypothetical protein
MMGIGAIPIAAPSMGMEGELLHAQIARDVAKIARGETRHLMSSP